MESLLSSALITCGGKPGRVYFEGHLLGVAGEDGMVIAISSLRSGTEGDGGGVSSVGIVRTLREQASRGHEINKDNDLYKCVQ